MPEYKITLLPDEKGNLCEVKADSTIPLGALLEFQKQGLLSKTFLKNLVETELDFTKFDFDCVLTAPYMAYKYANPNGMEYLEFMNRYVLDLDNATQMYMEIVGGKKVVFETAEEFVKATGEKTKPKTNKKK